MKLSDYIADMKVRRALADEVGTSPEYLWQLAVGWRGRRPRKAMALAIERATGGVVTRPELRPDLFTPVPAEQVDGAQLQLIEADPVGRRAAA